MYGFVSETSRPGLMVLGPTNWSHRTFSRRRRKRNKSTITPVYGKTSRTGRPAGFSLYSFSLIFPFSFFLFFFYTGPSCYRVDQSNSAPSDSRSFARYLSPVRRAAPPWTIFVFRTIIVILLFIYLSGVRNSPTRQRASPHSSAPGKDVSENELSRYPERTTIDSLVRRTRGFFLSRRFQ